MRDHRISGEISRRHLLATTGVLAAGVGAGLLPLATAGAKSAAPLTASTFAHLVGQPFHLAVRGRSPVRLRLEAVDGVGGRAATESAFSLRFTGPRAAKQGGEVGTLSGPGLAFDLLVVPSGRALAHGQEWSVTVVGGGHRG